MVRPKRKFEVYAFKRRYPREPWIQVWGWRCRSVQNAKIVFTSGESFHDKSGALRAARREANLMRDGVAVVVVV